jgi:hypothetical protein
MGPGTSMDDVKNRNILPLPVLELRPFVRAAPVTVQPNMPLILQLFMLLHAGDSTRGSQHADYVRYEGFTAVTMLNGVFWDDTPCGSCKNRCFGVT